LLAVSEKKNSGLHNAVAKYSIIKVQYKVTAVKKIPLPHCQSQRKAFHQACSPARSDPQAIATVTLPSKILEKAR